MSGRTDQLQPPPRLSRAVKEEQRSGPSLLLSHQHLLWFQAVHFLDTLQHGRVDWQQSLPFSHHVPQGHGKSHPRKQRAQYRVASTTSGCPIPQLQQHMARVIKTHERSVAHRVPISEDLNKVGRVRSHGKLPEVAPCAVVLVVRFDDPDSCRQQPVGQAQWYVLFSQGDKVRRKDVCADAHHCFAEVLTWCQLHRHGCFCPAQASSSISRWRV
mmetsp:Transcript_30203/g.80571  ORF Transcript_30203/g.80571 Transcript_30203/m.80571 type:complete len:214 (-) Transcript_30203:75-716(-)